MANFDAARFDADIRELLEAMPAHAIVADVPSFYFLPREKQVHIANRLLHAAARERGLTDVPLRANTDGWGIWGVLRQFSGDLFHPNDRGYEVWADTFLPAVDARLHTLARR
jgi:acyl-CoA thioesterase-1